ncbi:MAG: 30S ribosome-binding factor RbfA [Chloroflexi bacterium]|nr:MAG: 30S ribosome-binding factor RbfA [Chloroflexota bacterium]RLC96721.1 MAG: 30S ribosome-binding factor RbfA [Chloroflexota bacterium]
MSRRLERVNSLVRQEISDLLQREVKDPRLGGLVTITEVSTSRDLRHAKVLVSVIGSDSEQKEVLATLTTASGFMRRELSRRLRLRRIPELVFEYDESIDRGAHVLQLISQVVTDESSPSQASGR